MQTWQLHCASTFAYTMLSLCEDMTFAVEGIPSQVTRSKAKKRAAAMHATSKLCIPMHIPAADSDHICQTNCQETFQELIQCMVGEADYQDWANTGVGLGVCSAGYFIHMSSMSSTRIQALGIA